ncbi:hypothetical protein TNCV_3684491 [Trichonephila clavipes]|uniref:Uncharacterized protein n=1 Tax=Trichonephila clavipes TaxID=2585209 RepID=A0A8X6RUN1_TRICX|nr:hypothetical protein TNCV_3684491 [Trichonephila clavipes]
MVEVTPINISLTQHSPSLSVRTTISPTLTEEFIIHPSVYTEIKKIRHAKRDVLLRMKVNDQIDDWLQQGIIREKCSDYCSPLVLCEKVNGAMKMSSVGSNSRSPTPSPMEGKHSRFAMLRRLFKPWKWERKKRAIVLNRRPEL